MYVKPIALDIKAYISYNKYRCKSNGVIAQLVRVSR